MAIGNFGFGLAEGLAFKRDLNAEMSAAQREDMLDRQARQDAEQRAKLFADDLEFGSAINVYDKGVLSEFTNSRLKDIGRYTMDNPDYLYNPAKAIELKRLKRSLLDNDIVARAGRVDAEIKSYQAYIQDPKNTESGLLNQEEMKIAAANLRDYLKTGSADGIAANAKEFTWAAPEKRIDHGAMIAERFKQIEQHGLLNLPDRGHKLYTTKEDKRNTAIQILNDQSVFGASVNRMWLGFTDEEKSQYGREGDNDWERRIDWVEQQGAPFIAKDQIKQFAPPRDSSGRATGTGTPPTATIDPFQENVVDALEALRVTKNAQGDSSELRVSVAPDAIIKNIAVTGSENLMGMDGTTSIVAGERVNVDEYLPAGTTKQAFTNGAIVAKLDENGQIVGYEADMTVELTLQQFRAMNDAYIAKAPASVGAKDNPLIQTEGATYLPSFLEGEPRETIHPDWRDIIEPIPVRNKAGAQMIDADTKAPLFTYRLNVRKDLPEDFASKFNRGVTGQLKFKKGEQASGTATKSIEDRTTTTTNPDGSIETRVTSEDGTKVAVKTEDASGAIISRSIEKVK